MFRRKGLKKADRSEVEREIKEMEDVINKSGDDEYLGPKDVKPIGQATKTAEEFYDVIEYYDSNFYIEDSQFASFARSGKYEDPERMERLLKQMNVDDPNLIYGIIFDGPTGEGEGLVLLFSTTRKWIRYDLDTSRLQYIDGEIKHFIKRKTYAASMS